jgi:hypothetical protein
MKELIRKIIREAQGVPEGILDSAEKLYDLSFSKLKRYNPSNGEKIYNIKTNMDISDYNIQKIILKIDFTETDQVDEVVLLSMAFGNRSEFDDSSFKLINVISPNEISVSISMAGPEDTENSDLLDFFVKEKAEMTSSLSHELQHAFNFYKQGSESLKGMAQYAGYQRTSFPFKPIQDFLHYLYFIHNVENLVRPTEVASFMKSGDVDKQGFYDFILNNKTYKILKKINNFTYEGLREELKSDIPKIDHFFDRIDLEDIPETDDGKVDELLRIVYINLVNNSLQATKGMMTNNFLEQFLGFIGDKDKFFDKMIKFFSRFDKDPKQFYIYEEKNFKYVSNIMMKKIIKVYALAKENPKSIKDWELHQKINNTNENIDLDYKFKTKKK